VFVDGWDDERLVKFTPDGVAHPGECRLGDYDCGIHVDDFVPRIPDFVAPVDSFKITRITLANSPIHYEDGADGSNPHDEYDWVVDGRGCGFSYGLGHMGTIGPELRAAMLERGLPDPSTQMQTETLFDDFYNPIVLTIGDRIGKPQVRYEAMAGHEGYATASDTPMPMAQIEFNILRNDVEYDTAEAEWNFLPKSVRDDIETAIYTEAAKEDSFRYVKPYLKEWEWLWRAELVMEATAPFSIDEAGSIQSQLGGWYEIADTTPCEDYFDEQCDETFSIFPIHKESPFYSAALYDSANITHLAQRTTGEINDFGEVLGDVPPISGTITIKWRPRGLDVYYQRVSYRVQAETSFLLMNSSETSTTRSDIPTPTIPSEQASCDNVQGCYTLKGFGIQ